MERSRRAQGPALESGDARLFYSGSHFGRPRRTTLPRRSGLPCAHTRVRAGLLDDHRPARGRARRPGGAAGGAPAPGGPDTHRAPRRSGQDPVRRGLRRGSGRGGPHALRAARHASASRPRSAVRCAARSALRASAACGADLTAEEMVDQVLHFARRAAGRRPARDQRRVHGHGRAVPQLRADAACLPFAQRSRTGSAWRRGPSPCPRPAWCRRSSASRASRCSSTLPSVCTPPPTSCGTRLVPLNRTYPLNDLLAACRRYVTRTRRKLMFEYVVLRGVNDGPEQVAALAKLVARPLLPPQPDRLQRDRRRLPPAAERNGWPSSARALERPAST